MWIQWVLSLPTFFAPAKKVGRLQAKALDLESGYQREDRRHECLAVSGANSNGFRLPARYFLLLAQKKVPKEDALPRDVKPAQGMCDAVAIFGLAIHGSIRKRPPSMATALRVYGSIGI